MCFQTCSKSRSKKDEWFSVYFRFSSSEETGHFNVFSAVAHWCYFNLQFRRKEEAVEKRARGEEEKRTWSCCPSWSHLDAWERETGDAQFPERKYVAVCFCSSLMDVIIQSLDPHGIRAHSPFDDVWLFLSAHQSLVAELLSLPLKADNLSVRSRSAHLECRLSEIEEAIKIFSRDKVYVKIDS